MALKSRNYGVMSGIRKKPDMNSPTVEDLMIQEVLADPTLELELDGMIYGGLKTAHRQMCELNVALQRLGRKNGSS